MKKITSSIQLLLITSGWLFTALTAADQPDTAPIQNGSTQAAMIDAKSTQANSENSGQATHAVAQDAHKKTAQDAKEIQPKDIYLNFENTELSNFIEYIAELKKLNIIPDKALEGSKVSLTVREPLSVDGAWNIFLTVLDMAGFAIIEAGDVHKIVTKDKKLNEPLPAYINTPYDQLPDNDSTIRYVTFLTNIPVADVEPVLTSMLSNPSVILSQKEMNAFIITDKSYNIKSAVKLIQELDQMGLPESVTVLKLKQANASDVKQLLDALIKKPEGSALARLLGKTAEGGTEYFSQTTRVITEERTNSLILLGNSKSIDKVVDFITKHIDTTFKEAESPIHIYELQNIDATQVMNLLKEVTTPLDSATGQTASKYGSIRGGVKYFKPINITVDKSGNRLIISCVDKQDWKMLKKTLDDLDKPQPQVAFDTMLVTVSVDDSKTIGGMARLKKHGQIGKNVDFQSASLTNSPSLEYAPDGKTPISLLGSLINQIVFQQGQTVLTFGPNNNIWGIFNMIKDQTNTSIISQPFVAVANKTTAVLDVGETRRVPSAVVQGTSQTTGYNDVEASTHIEVTPQINLDGVIQLKVHVDIGIFTDTTGNDKSTQSLDTHVSVADGQVLVLGGFVQTKVTESTIKTPFLSDIPILKWLFTSKTREITKQYLFIFLSPTIIKPRSSPGMQLYTKMKLHQATEDVEDAVETKPTLDPIHNWFFNPDKEQYSHKVVDFANARYQPTTVDIKNDPYYRTQTQPKEFMKSEIEEEIGESEQPLSQTSLNTKTNAQHITKPKTVHDVQQKQPVQSVIIPEQRLEKETTAAPSYANASEQISDSLIPTEVHMREDFKKLLEIPDQKSQMQSSKSESTIVVDTQKRNTLRDFLKNSSLGKTEGQS